MRSPKTVAVSIWKLIPNERVKFRRDMLNLINMNNSEYSPPEGVTTWDEIQMVLMEHIRQPKEDFEFGILSLFTMRSIAVLKSLKWD